MSDDRDIPEGRLARFARMAGAGLRAGSSLLGEKAAQRGATEAARVLGELRGLGTKAGQMMSYVDGFMPEGQRDAFESAMRRLRAAAPTSSPEAIRAIVEEDLGAPLAELFAAWDDAPIASASIGQVHRARLPDGREVAVKVQHPGIDRAIESDLANVSMFDGLLGVMGGQRFDSAAVFATVRARFREELDYALEARRQAEFAALHQGDPLIVVPEVIVERSARRVLTTALMRGESFEEACQAPEARRRAHCEALFRFVFRTQLVGSTFNADPHPGNYLFRPDGTVIFFDYGCVQPLLPPQRDATERMHAAALTRDEAGFARAASALLCTRPGRLEEVLLRLMRRSFEPLFASPFRVTRPYVAELVEQIGEMKKATWRLPAKEVFALPPELMFTFRLQFGFYSVLARLDAEVDYAAVERGFWPELERRGADHRAPRGG